MNDIMEWYFPYTVFIVLKFVLLFVFIFHSFSFFALASCVRSFNFLIPCVYLQLSSKSKEIASYKSEISSFKQKKQALEQQVPL